MINNRLDEAKALAEAIRQNIEVLNINLAAARQLNLNIDGRFKSNTSSLTIYELAKLQYMELVLDSITVQEEL